VYGESEQKKPNLVLTLPTLKIEYLTNGLSYRAEVCGKNSVIDVLLTYLIEIEFAKHRFSTMGRGLCEMTLK
jgi:hypothetical protein